MQSHVKILQNDKILAALTLSGTPGITPAILRRLLSCCGTLCGAFELPAAQAAAESGCPVDVLNDSRSVQRFDQAERMLATAIRERIMITTPEMETYPDPLRILADMPPLLFCQGSWSADSKCLGVVGTRVPTVHGVKNTRMFAEYFSRRGVVVVSGLARGVDAVAHEATLRSGGRTLAVLGSGLLAIYPKEHRKMAAQIAETGMLVSEFPLDSEPRPYHFPTRNRLISALTAGVLIVEAPKKSGALITADLSAELGKDVFAIPGSIHVPQSEGCNALIKEGAVCVTHPSDVMFHLRWDDAQPDPGGDERSGWEPSHPLAGVLSADEPMGVDAISGKAGLPVAEVLGLLTRLEAAGRVTAMAGQRYVMSSGDSGEAGLCDSR